MNSDRLLYLLNRDHSGNCTEAERRELEDWYSNLHGGGGNKGPVPGDYGDKKLTEEMLMDFKDRIGRVSTEASSRRWVLLAAAVLTGIICCVGISWYLFSRKPEGGQVGSTLVAELPAPNRFIELPDGSRVILHPGSTLDYPETFTGAAREVVLTGEAYFDIKHDQAKPFVIHSGNLKTVVLGTAFTIKAYPDRENITVMVTRGKVQVEDDKKVLAVLAPDQQFVYNSRTSIVKELDNPEVKQKLNWLRKDMTFDAKPFSEIAEHLGERYQVKIGFDNPALKECPVTASFSGTESLEHVLEVICTARNATYKIKADREIIIEGSGCDLN